MANTVKITAKADDKASSTLDKIHDKAAQISKQGAKGFGLGIGAGIGISAFGSLENAAGAAAAAVVQFGVDSISKASDLRESMALTQQVFEGNTDAVEKWATAKDDAFSQTEALNFASTFGNAFKNVGQSIDDATEHAETFTTLAGDLGSAFNKSSEEAATALRSGLLGESEPLRAFGVFLDEAKVKAKAAAMGMKPLNGALTDGQKVAARYAIIMEQTADSQGMFGRDTGSLADAQKKLSSNIDDLQAKLGTELIPLMVTATTTASTMVDGFDELTDIISENRAVISPLVDTLQLLTGTYAQLHQDTSKQAEGEKEANQIAADTVKSVKDRQAALQPYIDKLKKVDGATEGVADASAAAKTRIENIGKAAGITGAKFDDMRDAIRTAADLLNQQKRGHEETRLKIKGTELALKDNRAELKKLEDIKHPTRDQQIDINDLKIAILEGKDERQRLRADLEATGKVTMEKTKSWIDKLEGSTGEAGDKAQDLFYWLNKVSNLPGGGGGGGGKKSGANGGSGFNPKQDKGLRAAGGPVMGGGSYIVGEQGPELFMPGSSGTIVPNHALGGGGLNIYISGVSVLTPGSAEALARQLGPHVTRWQQQRGL